MSSSSSSSSSSFSPTSRSRTLLFLSYRDSTARSSRNRTNPFLPEDDGDEHQQLISHSEQGHVALVVSLPPKWVDISDQVHDILAATQQKISMLERLHAKHVLPGFADRSAEERQIEAITSDITRDFRRCHSLIQSIPAASAAAAQQQHSHTFPPRPNAQTQHEKLAAQNAQRALAAEVQELSATFRKKQRVYLETLQGHAIKNQDLLVASGALTLKGSEGMSDVDEDMRIASQNQSIHQLQQQEQQEDIDTTILTRDREITEIAKSIGALAELFRDLQTFVIDQGTLLDSVEYNIEQTSVYMQEAVTDLKVAEGYQRNTGRRKCIFLLLLIIFGLVVVLIFKPRRHAASAPPQTTTDSESILDSSVKDLPPIPVDVTPLNPGTVGIGAEVASAAGRVHSTRGQRPNPGLGSGSALGAGTEVNENALFRVGLPFTRRVDRRLASYSADVQDESVTETETRRARSQIKVQSRRQGLRPGQGRSRGRRMRRQDRDYG